MKRLGAVLLWPLVCFASSGPLPLVFEPNVGQSAKDVRYIARTPGAMVFIRNSDITFHRRISTGAEATLRLEFPGAAGNRVSSTSEWQALEPMPGTTSYMVGRDSSRWFRDIRHYHRLKRTDIFPGVDLVLYETENRIEYDFIVAPGADWKKIRLRFPNANLALEANGDLAVQGGNARIVQRAPRVFQTEPDGSVRTIPAAYRLVGRHQAALVLGPYDRKRAVTIDPVLESATLLGGSGDDRVFVADPVRGIAGSTTSADFPGVEAAQHGGLDVFVYDPVSQSSFIVGGSGDENVTCTAPLTPTGFVVAGYTNSRDLPVPSNRAFQSLQSTYGGGDWDGFVMYFYALSGSPTISYLGGSGDDRILATAVGYSVLLVGSTTSADFPVVNAWQTRPGGAVDGFAALVSTDGFVGFSSYLGGSGDDRVLAAAFGNATTYLSADAYIAGETKSSDLQLPGKSAGSPNGSSDGFIIHIKGNFQTGFTPSESTFTGGSGDDRITALTGMPNGIVSVAGVTTSTDLPVPGGFQTTYGGGASDAFISQYSADLQTLLYGTYYGGSAAEEPLSMASNSFNELIVGGWTNSVDLPVVDPMPSACGRGPEDGFLLHLDSNLNRIFSTCYGGSGADRINWVGFDNSARVVMGGTSNSTDLPLTKASQAVNAGSLDGFYGLVDPIVIHAGTVTVGKNLEVTATTRLGDSTNYLATPLTITTTDPSSVLVATNPDDPGQVSVTVANGLSGQAQDYARRDFLVYCLTDNGTYALKLSAPEYPSRTMSVRCLPSVLYLTPQDVLIPFYSFSTQGSGFAYITTAMFDPSTMTTPLAQGLSGAVGSVPINVTTSNTDYVKFDQPSFALDPYSTADLRLSFSTNGTGAADATFSTSSGFSFWPSNVIHVHTGDSSAGTSNSLYIPRAAKDTTVALFVQGQFPITLTSSDPSKALIATSPVQRGQASASVSTAGGGYLEVLDTSGPVSVTAVDANGTSVTTSVRFGDLAVQFTQNLSAVSNLSVLPGATITANVHFLVSPYDQGSNYNGALFRREGATPLQFQLVSSNPAVASIASGTFSIPPTSAFSDYSISIPTQSAGEAIIAPQISSGSLHPFPLTIDVQPPYIQMSPVTLGNNLEAFMGLLLQGPFPGGGPIPITVTSSDPSKVLVSPDAVSAGQGSFTLSSPYSNAAFYVQAVAGSGTVDVTATVPGFAPGKSTVTLVPSGFAWSTSFIDLTNSSSNPGNSTALLASYALDPVNNAALARQQVRPGLNGSIALNNSNPDAVTVSPTSILLSNTGVTGAFPPPGYAVTLTSVNGGEAQISFEQPPGFVAPVGRGPLHVKSPRATLVVPPTTVARNFQGQITIQLPRSASANSAAVPVTLTSGDPTKLAISGNSIDLGGPSATLPTAPQTATFYLNALDGPVDVKVTASAPAFDSATGVVSIVPAYIGFGGPNGPQTVLINSQDYTPPSLTLYATQPSTGIPYYSNGPVLRPGLDPIPVTISNSNPAVVTVTGTPILNSLTNRANVPYQVVGIGTAQLTPVPPPGFLLAPPSLGRTLTFSVAGPSFPISGLTIGQDLQATLKIAPQYSIPASNDVTATITSSDPSKVVLSADPHTLGSGSVTLTFPTGQTTPQAIYVQSLDQAGSVTITISGDGISASSAQVTLQPTAFRFDTSSLFLSLQNGASTARLHAGPANFNATYPVRAGISGIPVLITNSSPGVVSVPNQLVVLPATDGIDVPLTPLGPGIATLTFSVPSPYTKPSPLTVQVQGSQIQLSPGAVAIGKNLQSTIAISTPDGQSATVTVTSSDATRLLVSTSAVALGQASVSDLVPARTQSLLYLQALSDTGSVTVSASAPGYQSSTMSVQLSQSAATLGATSLMSTLTTLSPAVTNTINLGPYPGFSVFPAQTLRGGAPPVTVPITLSDPKVGSLTPPQVIFNPGDSSKTFSFQPQAAGSALLSLGVPAGFADPLSLRQQLISVVQPRLSFSGPLSVAKDLQKVMTVNLPSSVSSQVTVTLTSSDPSRLLLSEPTAITPASSVTLTLNTSGTASFNLIGLASSGTVTLNATSATLGTSSYDVSLQPSGFAFSSPVTTARTGSLLQLSILSFALNPLTLAPEASYALRPGVQPVAVTITSSDSSILSPDSQTVSFSPFDSQHNVTLSPNKAGTSTVTIQTPSGFATPSSGTSTTIRVQ